MRFHRSFLENGKVFVEILQKDCPLTADKAALFLQLLQTEADIQKRIPSTATVLSRVLQQIPKLVESMQVFTPSMDVPNAPKNGGTLSSSSEDKKVSKNNSETNQNESAIGSQMPETSNNFNPSPNDEFVPAPRTAGCRFNGSGFLVTFGRIHYAPTRSLRNNKNSIGDNIYGSSRKISFHANEEEPPPIPSNRHRHSARSNYSGKAETKKESYRNYSEFLLAHLVMQTTMPSTKRDFVSHNAERFSISGGSPQSGFGYMTSVQSTTNMTILLQRANPVAKPTNRTSPSPSVPSGTSRSYSLQNVSQSLRHRGNSITGVPVDETALITEPMYSSVVLVYDATGLLPVSKDLAAKYKLLGSNALELCRYNQKLVEKSNRKDLLIVWKLLEQCIQTAMKSENNGIPNYMPAYNFGNGPPSIKNIKYFRNPFKTAWSHHPFGRDLVNNLLDHYNKLCDLQTTAVITCILGQHVHKQYPSPSKLPPLSSNPFQPTSTDVPPSSSNDLSSSISNSVQRKLVVKEKDIPSTSAETVLRKTADELRTVQLKIHRSSSCDDVENVASSGGDELAVPSRKLSPSTLSTTYSAHETMNNSDSSTTLTFADGLETLSKQSSKEKSESLEPNRNEYLLDPALASRFEDARLQYADILYRWRMYSKCTEVLKYCFTDTGIEQINEVCFCVNCRESLRNVKKCQKCHTPPITCAICDLPCRGATVTCPYCSHGGHLEHMIQWFQNQQTCPLSCGCDCKF